MDTPRAEPEPPPAVRAQAQARLVRALSAVLAPDALLWTGEDTAAYAGSGLARSRTAPLAVALPHDEAQLQAVLRVCHALAVPVVPRGGGTALSGGAQPHPMGLTLGLARLNQIRRLDPLARTAVVQAGARLQTLGEAAAAFGLRWASDPSRLDASTLGGTVAENAPGASSLSHGPMLQHLLQARGYTADGEPVSFGSAAPEAPDDALLALLPGSRGTLAVLTECTLRLLPRPPLARCLVARFGSPRQAADAADAVRAAGLLPAALAILERPLLTAAFGPAGEALDAQALLLCECEGTRETVQHALDGLQAALRAAGASDLSPSSDEAQRQRLWRGCRHALPAAGRLAPNRLCLALAPPRGQLGALLDTIAQKAAARNLRCASRALGDHALHTLILFDASDPAQQAQAERLRGEILDAGSALGDRPAEPGQGAQACAQRAALRQAFDPLGRLNPGLAPASAPA